MFYRLSALGVIIFIVLLNRIYLTLYSADKPNNGTISTTSPPISVYMCPQSPTSKGYFHVDFINTSLLDYKTVCKSNDTLLIYVLSKADHIKRRKAIRRTWANREHYHQLFSTCFIFLIGLSRNSSINFHISSEISIHRDIVQLNINETYHNIVYKEVGGLKWSHMYASHIPYLFKTDDDIIIDTLLLSDISIYFLENHVDHSDYMQRQNKMKEFTQQISVINKNSLFKGMYIDGQKIIRRGKFGLQHIAWNFDKLPGYCRGAGYMFSSVIRDRLYRASLCYAIEYIPWMGDLFVSGSLASAAAVRCSSWSMEYAYSHDGCSLRFQNQPGLLVCSTPMHVGRLHMEEYDQAWTAILQRHLVTNETNAKAKRKRLALIKQRRVLQLPLNESIVEEIQNMNTPQEKPIVPLSLLEETLDE